MTFNNLYRDTTSEPGFDNVYQKGTSYPTNRLPVRPVWSGHGRIHGTEWKQGLQRIKQSTTNGFVIETDGFEIVRENFYWTWKNKTPNIRKIENQLSDFYERVIDSQKVEKFVNDILSLKKEKSLSINADMWNTQIRIPIIFHDHLVYSTVHLHHFRIYSHEFDTHQKISEMIAEMKFCKLSEITIENNDIVKFLKTHKNTVVRDTLHFDKYCHKIKVTGINKKMHYKTIKELYKSLEALTTECVHIPVPSIEFLTFTQNKMLTFYCTDMALPAVALILGGHKYTKETAYLTSEII